MQTVEIKIGSILDIQVSKKSYNRRGSLTTRVPFSLPVRELYTFLDFRERTFRIFRSPIRVEVWVAPSLFAVESEQI